jgi:hypothetical protein
MDTNEKRLLGVIRSSSNPDMMIELAFKFILENSEAESEPPASRETFP